MGIHLTIKDMQDLADKRKGKCLSKKYNGYKSKLTWQCEKGHTWDARPDYISKGNWCPQCRRNDTYLTQMQQLAEQKGGECLSSLYISNSDKLTWKCANGHTWKATRCYTMTGAWCPQCRRNDAYLSQIHKLAEQRNGKCLSPTYINEHTALEWLCEKEHVWKDKPRNVKSGSWCPECKTKKVSIEILQELATKKKGKCLSKKYINVHEKLRWQCEHGHKWSADYNNIKKGKWCPECARLRRYKTIDDMHALAKKHGGKCLSKKYIDCKTKLKWQCKKGHTWSALSFYIRRGNWCPTCEKKIYTIEEMRRIAITRSGKCLSSKMESSASILDWQCDHGHVWSAQAYNIQTGGWCPQCSKVRKWTLDEVKDIAKQKGGECRSKKYINTTTKLTWECAEGHIWDATLFSVYTQNSWCPVCSGNKKHTIEDMHNIAKKHKGQFLSKEYINSKIEYTWQCKNGHIWDARPVSVINGAWCKICKSDEKLDELKKIARQKKGKCLALKYINNIQNVPWECKKGHQWMASPRAVKAGVWCKQCK